MTISEGTQQAGLSAAASVRRGRRLISRTMESARLRQGSSCRNGFALFLILTAILFVRPAEIFSDLDGWPIYEVVILLCVAVSLPALSRKLRWRSLAKQPAHLCVIALLPALVLSHLSHGDIWHARMNGLDFFKQLVFYLLLISLLNTRRRLRIFLVALFGFIATVSLLSVLTFHGFLDVGHLAPLDQNEATGDGGDTVEVMRLVGPGIFNDPNDLSIAIVTAMVIGAHLFLEGKHRVRQLALLPVMAILAYAFYLTKSRGGFLSLMAASGVFLLCRYPLKRAILIILIAAPLMVVLFGGRQTDLNLGDDNDTAQGRIHLWRDSLVLFHQAPLFGIGSNQLQEVNDLVAHNSYVQAFAELGLLGGTLFVGTLTILFSDLFRLCRALKAKATADASGWTGCVLAILAGYSVGLFSLTRIYEVSTYVILGVAASFAAVAAAENPRVRLLRGGKLAIRIGMASMGCLLCLEFCARFLAT